MVDKDIHFPLCGIDRSRGFERQPVRQTMAGKYARTTPLGINVRAYDAILNRYRGGSRPGLARAINVQVNGKRLIQGMGLLSGSGYTAPGGGVQTSQSGRVVTRVYVSGGTIKVADAGAESYTTPTNGASALNSSGVVFMSALNQKMYFADGVNWKYYDPATNTVSAWTETGAGDLPEDSDGNPPRLIETWHGCIALAGWVKDPQNVILSKVGDAHNFDFSPVSPAQTDAVAFNGGSLGVVGDMVTGLVPFNDDILFIGGDHTLWMLRGHPLAGGRLDRISDTVGMAWGRAWCKDPHGVIYFVSNRMGIYRVAPGSLPQRISQQIEQLLVDVNTGAKTISLAWDDRFQGLHVFMTTTAAATATDQHFFFEARTGAWWIDVLGHKNFNPLCTMVVDGNLPEDRHTEIGSWDGYIRFLDPDAVKDDGYAINSEVWLGPLLTKDSEELVVHEGQAIMAEDSGDVSYSVFVGKTAEQAFDSDSVLDGTWIAGRNHSDMIRRAGHAVYVRITTDVQWAMELVRFTMRGTGVVRRRGA
jgi:hypothetical protein